MVPIYTRFRVRGVDIGVMSSSEIRNPCTIGGDPWKERGRGCRERKRERGFSILRGRKSSNAELARKVLAPARSFYPAERIPARSGPFSRSERQGRLYHTRRDWPHLFFFSLSLVLPPFRPPLSRWYFINFRPRYRRGIGRKTIRAESSAIRQKRFDGSAFGISWNWSPI